MLNELRTNPEKIQKLVTIVIVILILEIKGRKELCTQSSKPINDKSLNRV